MKNRYTPTKSHQNSMLAFPNTMEYGAAIEKPRCKKDRNVLIACAVIMAAYVCMALAGWLPGSAA